MPRKKSFEQSTDELLQIGASELLLRIKRETISSFFSPQLTIQHNMLYSWITEGRRHESIYHIEHEGFFERDFTQRTLARLLYEDLSKVLKQAQTLKSRNIDLKLNVDGLGLSYLNHGSYSLLQELDVLSLPNLLMDIKRYYRLK